MSDPHAAGKQAAGRAAADLVPDGARLGLGTGSTFVHALERLAERVHDERLEIVGVSTSEDTTRRARLLGIRLAALDDVERLDLAIDGADEIDQNKDMIKGGGGALLREKIVAAAAREMIVIVSANKVVAQLGLGFPLPIEVLQFGWKQSLASITALGCTARRRVTPDGRPFVSDNGNYVIDCDFGAITAPAGLGRELSAIPGVVGHGLFTGMAGRVLVGAADGTVRLW